MTKHARTDNNALALADLELVVLSVDDQCSNLLVHEQKYGGKKSWNECSYWGPAREAVA